MTSGKRPYPRQFITTLLAILLGIHASTIHAAVTYHSVALTGDIAPGTSTGVAFSGFETPVINQSGQIAFGAVLSGPDPFNSGIWLDTKGNLKLIAKSGDPAPGTETGVIFNGINTTYPSLNNNGHVAFSANLIGPDIHHSRRNGIWTDRSGTLDLVIRSGSDVEGADPGVIHSLIGDLVLNDLGEVIFHSRLKGTGITSLNNIGIFVDADSSIQSVYLNGDSAPGTNMDEEFSGGSVSSSEIAINMEGRITLYRRLVGPNVNNTNNSGVWLIHNGTTSLLIREGDAAPGMPNGVVFNSEAMKVFDLPTINNSGQVALNAVLQGPGIDNSNKLSLWLADDVSLRLIAQAGDQAAGATPGTTYTIFGKTQINGAGQIAFFSLLSGSVDGITSNSGLWLEDNGFQTLIARGGDAAPGMNGLRFRNFGAPIINDTGQVAFEAVFLGSGVNLSNNDSIWITDSHSELKLIVREGDLYDVNDDPLIEDLRTISFLDMLTGSSDDYEHPTSLNNNGQLSFYLEFTDGTSGIFVATIDLPGDLNSDGFVGIDDLTTVLNNWNQNVTPWDILAGDATGDGYVGIDDLNTILPNWNAGTTPGAPITSNPGSNTPEPASLLILTALLGSQLRRV